MLDFGGQGVRRSVGWAVAALALAALAVCLVLAGMALTFQLSTVNAMGEVVAVTAVPDPASGAPRTDRHAVVIEYPDRNGQFRRFDAEVEGDAPAKGSEIAVRYRMGPPVEARMANAWSLWRPATIAAGVALALGLIAEELLVQRRRTLTDVLAR